MDEDDSGTLDREEWVNHCHHLTGLGIEQELLVKTFEFVDLSGDGMVTLEEMAQGILKICAPPTALDLLILSNKVDGIYNEFKTRESSGVPSWSSKAASKSGSKKASAATAGEALKETLQVLELDNLGLSAISMAKEDGEARLRTHVEDEQQVPCPGGGSLEGPEELGKCCAPSPVRPDQVTLNNLEHLVENHQHLFEHNKFRLTWFQLLQENMRLESENRRLLCENSRLNSVDATVGI
eukprot:gnl/TRDRNA2_/TRDRNA2_163306_c0_seq1.p1 gnl/TRDRNA2_/TRDRNA2_163306_c0~~gnl/TRDRNA2_/TRDRNA2_163306_c0_seq1.p1  ORF type:complete len:255 (-),score=52.55 gnl/TRDRNA2_/TRDRNA2_163306_c0_seq1:251-967(-)